MQFYASQKKKFPFNSLTNCIRTMISICKAKSIMLYVKIWIQKEQRDFNYKIHWVFISYIKRPKSASCSGKNYNKYNIKKKKPKANKFLHHLL